jgi:large subunit ribosomal protein L30
LLLASIKIKLVKSVIGCPVDQRITVRTLGLKKLNHSVVREDTPQVRGMISKVKHLLKVEEV